MPITMFAIHLNYVLSIYIFFIAVIVQSNGKEIKITCNLTAQFISINKDLWAYLNTT